jgi:hypothetical protein
MFSQNLRFDVEYFGALLDVIYGLVTERAVFGHIGRNSLGSKRQIGDSKIARYRHSYAQQKPETLSRAYKSAPELLKLKSDSTMRVEALFLRRDFKTFCSQSLFLGHFYQIRSEFPYSCRRNVVGLVCQLNSPWKSVNRQRHDDGNYISTFLYAFHTDTSYYSAKD